MREFFVKYKPSVPRKHLLLVAAFVWLLAGGILSFRGLKGLSWTGPVLVSMLIAFAGGILFFYLLFLRISTKHIGRIKSLEILRPCVFSFFDFRSYLMMAIMITMGVTVRKLHLISNDIISYFFITMAIPLLLSSARFFMAWRQYDSIITS